MDAALAATLDALLDPSRVVWTKDRVQLGQEPGEGELFLGVGSREASLPPHPRMFSWKLPQWRTATPCWRSAAAASRQRGGTRAQTNGAAPGSGAKPRCTRPAVSASTVLRRQRSQRPTAHATPS